MAGPDTAPDAELDAALASAEPRAAVLDLARRRLAEARTRIAGRLAAGAPGVEVARAYAEAADQTVGILWQAGLVLTGADNPSEAERLSVIAVGGYGRGVLAPFSDLDLVFVRPWKRTARAEALSEFVLYGLWDLGLKVGWAFRSVSETLKLARQDMTIRTTLLEARHLAGDAELTVTLLERFRREVARADFRGFVAAKLAERDARHARAGVVRYRVEPNVKDGKGGLRDLNTLFWIARALDPDADLETGALADLLTPRERRTLGQAFDFLWAVRHHLHLVVGRAEEKLTFDLQPEIARRMRWSGRADEPAVERFMRRYFLVAREVGGLTRAFCAQLEARQAKPVSGLLRWLPLAAGRRRLKTEGLVLDGGRLTFAGPDALARDPGLMLRLFVEADRLGVDLHPDAFTEVSRGLSKVTPQMRRDPETARLFLQVLAHGERPYRTLSLMNEAGLLGRLLPEFARVVGQTQFNMYHAYTVDEHTLQAIGLIKDIERGRLGQDHPLASQILPLIGDREALYLAMLLHDVGKGGTRGQLDDGAIAARRACERLGLSRPRTELVAWLVAHHLVLSDFAQKRDVSDPATVAAFARLVGEPERLRLLLVMTVADVRAVGPGVWNGWKARLMRDLYTATERALRGEGLEPADLSTDDAALVDRARQGQTALRLVPRPDQGVTEVVVASPDRPGLFADLASALAAEGADVRGAIVRTLEGEIALDRFVVQHADARALERLSPQARSLERALKAAARGKAPMAGPPVDAALSPIGRRRSAFEVAPVVAFDDADETVTIVEASGPDRPGLLAELARAFSAAGVQIRSAHIDSRGERAIDAFYASEAGGGALKPATRRRLQRALTAALDASAPPTGGRGRGLARARAAAPR